MKRSLLENMLYRMGISNTKNSTIDFNNVWGIVLSIMRM